MTIKYLHTMVRVKDINESLHFYCNLLGLEEIRRTDYEQGKFTLVFLAPPEQKKTMIELTYNWNILEEYNEGRNFGHLAFEVEDIYKITEKLMDNGVVINRPPRDGRMVFVRSPDNVSIELLQKGNPKQIVDPWKSMENIGKW
jgi:lactoylglutathione lyase